jgi:lysophospholipase L1-like esterase
VSLSNRPRLVLGLLIASVAVNVLGLAAVAARVSRRGGLSYVMERLDLRDAKPPKPEPFQVDWQARLRKLPNTDGEIVFAGDSLVAEGPWAELFSPIKNRGIGGETTTGLLARLDEVTESRPRKVFLLIGTNCLAAEIPVAQVVRNYRKILERIRADSPTTRIYALSLLPVNQGYSQGKVIQDNPTIREANRLLRELVSEFPGAEFVDVHDALADADGNLRKDLTYDGLHLTLDAYLILGERLKDKVKVND